MTEQTSHIIMDDDRLKKYGTNTAHSLKQGDVISPLELRRILKKDLRIIEETHQSLGIWASGRQAVPLCVTWLLDNGDAALREGREVLGFFHRRADIMRGCKDGSSLLLNCAKAALWGVADLKQQRIAIYLTGFQSVVPLTEAELSQFVPAITIALLHSLARLISDKNAMEIGAVDGAYIGEIFTNLRTLATGQWAILLEEQSIVEQTLRCDPTGEYAQMEEETRRHYRQTLCQIARRLGVGEGELAKKIVARCQKGLGAERHVGYHLFTVPLGERRPKWTGRNYGIAILMLTAGLTLFFAIILNSMLLAFLLIFPLSDIVKNMVDFLVIRMVHPRPIHRMALVDGIPKEGKTLCVIVSLITDSDSGKKRAKQLEGYRLTNRDSGKELLFGILADIPDSKMPISADQWEQVAVVHREIEQLNRTYGGGFYLLFRKPTYHDIDKKYQGWERKRGALLELSRLLRRQPCDLRVLAGEEELLQNIHYVITLDSDTSLTVGSAKEMVGAMLHPLNRPQVDKKRRVVISGYGLLQPRVSIGLESANTSLFARIFGGQGGIDPYGSTASDVYHDLFDQGSYTGKGIFDVAVFSICLDGRFPDHTVLSHDLLEGAYLHSGLLSTVELTDGFPWRVDGYFARLHRWVRGDWQTLPWLGNHVPNGGGGYEKNPLSALARWKIFDNLRRSLSPVFTLLALVLGICFSNAVFAVAGMVALLSAGSNLLLSGVDLVARRGTGSRVRYHSTVIAGLAGTILQTLLQLLLLPYQSYICTSGMITALFRMCITHKNLLEWVTASQCEEKQDGVYTYMRHQWFAILLGAVTIWGADLWMGMAIGILWMISPVIAWCISRPMKKKQEITEVDKQFLLHEASLIWGYFHRFLREEEHFLPPDHWQEQPSGTVVTHTSPTNIGMALLSVMGAVDLAIITREKGEALLCHIIDTLEKLEKWHGHLYNWYDTKTATPMQPLYVSTVDSGNLCGCLIALREGLLQWGNVVLSHRVDVLATDMKFTPLFDKKRKLFSIGWDAEHGKLTTGHYDLMASEARQTSYIAVARGEVDPRHWRKLGRMLLEENDYRGMASWTGTMFEYFMPNLLLPCEKNSLIYEALCFCIYGQKRRGATCGVPWGISESGFYAFDSAMHYQYKAHGVQSLGLKRGLDDELVVAPYATFLALILAPRCAIRNLRKLSDLGATGVYGFYEAVDYTATRTEGDQKYAVVRSYMSHHLGMSLLAIVDVLKDNIMQNRFMADSNMSAYRELLQERIPVGTPVMRRLGQARGNAKKRQPRE